MNLNLSKAVIIGAVLFASQSFAETNCTATIENFISIANDGISRGAGGTPAHLTLDQIKETVRMLDTLKKLRENSSDCEVVNYLDI